MQILTFVPFALSCYHISIYLNAMLNLLMYVDSNILVFDFGYSMKNLVTISK